MGVIVNMSLPLMSRDYLPLFLNDDRLMFTLVVSFSD